jgi:hypothetical protein
MTDRKMYKEFEMTQEQFDRSLSFILNDKDSAEIIYKVKLNSGRVIYVVPEELYCNTE